MTISKTQVPQKPLEEGSTKSYFTEELQPESHIKIIRNFQVFQLFCPILYIKLHEIEAGSTTFKFICWPIYFDIFTILSMDERMQNPSNELNTMVSSKANM